MMKSKNAFIFSITFLATTLLVIFIYNKIYINYFSDYNWFNDPQIIPTLLDVLLGCLFGLEHIIKNINTKGTWKINWVRLFAIGIPFLMLSLPYTYIFIITKLSIFLHIDTTVYIICRLMFSYVVITSFNKIDTRATPHNGKS